MPEFDSAKDGFLKAAIDLETIALKVLLKSGVPADINIAENLDDIPLLERVATTDLIGQDLVAGPDPVDLDFIADDTTFFSVSGGQVNQVIIYVDGPSEALSPLVWERNVVFVPGGSNIVVEWGSHIFTKDCQGGNDFYFNGKKLIYSGGIDFLADDIRAILVDGTYVFDSINHVLQSDIPIGNRIGNVAGYDLTGKLVGNDDGLLAGVFDASDVIISALTGVDVEAIVLVQHLTATPEDSPLIAYLKEGMNLPFTPDGSLTGVNWSNQPAS